MEGGRERYKEKETDRWKDLKKRKKDRSFQGYLSLYKEKETDLGRGTSP